MRAICVTVALLALAACAEDPPPKTVRIGERVELLLHTPDDVFCEPLTCGLESQRACVPEVGEPLWFPVEVGAQARLTFSVGFGKRGPEPPARFQAEVLVERGEQRASVWEGEVSRPPAAPWTWQGVDVDLGPWEGARVGFLTTALEDGDTVLERAPAFGNPVLHSVGRMASPAQEPRRNVVVFLVDTLRADRLGCYGYERPTSPCLDAVAADALLFENASSISSWTKSSVASLFTSRYPSQHGAEDYGHRMYESEVTLAQLFGAAGYCTAAIGHSEWVFNPVFNLNQGFHETHYVTDGSFVNHTPALRVVDCALAWLDEHYDEPFFLYVHTVDPHAPYTPPAEYDRFQAQPYEGTLEPTNLGPQSFLRRKAEQVTATDLQYLNDLYDAEVLANDAAVGRLVARLQELGVWDETTFVFVSDHGEEFQEHGGWSHGATLYEEQLQVPLVIKPPRSSGIEGLRIDTPVSILDIAPSVCRLAGVEATRAPFQGAGLLDLDPDRATPLVAELNKEAIRRFSLRRGSVKYIVSELPEAREQVFHLGDDPAESNDLLGELEPAVLQSLRETLAAFRQLAGAEGLFVECHSADDESHDVVIQLEFDAAFTDFNLIDADFVSDRGQQVSDTRLDLFLEVGGRDRHDACLLRGLDAQTVTISATVDGVDLEARHILLGPTADPAPSAPVRVSMDDPQLLVETALQSQAPAPGVTLRVYRRVRPELDLDPGVVENLRAMGYAVDDE